ncbi:MAG: DoxX family protein [Alphaproteobacteria bacterium]|nr:DoxX family protein [Alphaproteobacteria bacterium]MCW5744229.1 DoxX family protein [Alphaproteobacteria bacterium]
MNAYRTLATRLEAFPQPLLQFAMRLGIFFVFWRSGMLKAANMEQAVALFRDEYLSTQDKEPVPVFFQELLRIPNWPAEAMAWAATAVELGGPALILAGLATRLSAAALIGMTLFIQFCVYWRDYPSHLLWLSILLFILVRGPGPWSLDRLLGFDGGPRR